MDEAGMSSLHFTAIARFVAVTLVVTSAVVADEATTLPVTVAVSAGHT
jgi:hypothetical protein